jgi:predicted nucleotidyltransferase/DNA-binding XRE family transcriptional regulator
MTGTTGIGTALISARKSRGLTQRALGEKLGVKQQQIARWERTGYRSASLERVVAVAQAVDVGLELLVAGVPMAAKDPAAYDPLPADTPPEVAVTLRRVGVSYPALAAFARSHGIERLELFGSVLTPEFESSSDVDVLVTYAEDRRPSLLQAGDHEAELAAMMRRRVDLVSRSAVEGGHNRVRRDAILGTAKTVYAAR